MQSIVKTTLQQVEKGDEFKWSRGREIPTIITLENSLSQTVLDSSNIGKKGSDAHRTVLN